MSNEDLLQRLEAMERRVQELEAERSTLRAPVRVLDEQERVLLEVSADRAGNVLHLYHPDGRPAVSVSTSSVGGAVITCDEQGNPAVSVYANGSAYGGVVEAHGPSGGVVAQLAGTPDGGQVAVCHPNGNPVGTLSVDAAGAGEFQLTTGEGTPTAELSAILGDGALLLMNQDGDPNIWFAPMRDGSGGETGDGTGEEPPPSEPDDALPAEIARTYGPNGPSLN